MDSKYRAIIFISALLSIITFCLHSLAHSTETTNYTFTKIADFQTGIPAGTGNFSVLGDPSTSEGNVVFYGSGGGLAGIYLYENLANQLAVVADINTIAPGGTGNFTKFEGVPSISAGDVAFWGLREGIQGIYSYVSGMLDVVSDGDTSIPEGDGDFASFRRYPSISNEAVALASFSVGVYSNFGGPLSKIADRDTSIPGGSGQFGNFAHVSMSNGNIVFKGSGGIYTSIDGQLDVVADLNTAIPGGTGNFISLGNPSISGDKVIFYGEGSAGQSGIYLFDYSENQLEVVVDEDSAIPGHSETFNGFYVSPSISGDKVAFKGTGSGFQGIYLFSDSSIEKIIERGDVIDGRTVVSVDLGSEGLDGDQIAFRAYLNDATYGIFIASPTTSFIHYSGNNHWYGIFDTKKDWHSAKFFCEALGGYLTTLTSTEEDEFVYRSLAKNYKYFWLGATDEISEGTWQWVTGEDWNYTNWAPTQPDDGYTGQDYLVFNPLYPNQWDDNGPPNDDLELDFICEWNDLDDYANIIQKTDIDNDGTTDGLDLSHFIAAFGSQFGEPNYNPIADFDDDGDVDYVNLITFAYMFGRNDPTRTLSTVPVLDQSDYKGMFCDPTEPPPNNCWDDVCAGCVPTSLAMLFINNFDVHNGLDLEIPKTDTDDDGVWDEYKRLVLDIADESIDDILDYDSELCPKGVNVWSDSLPVKMSAYTWNVDTDETDGFSEQIEWIMEYPVLTEKSNEEWIAFISDKLVNGEPTLFGGHFITPNSSGGHASIIAGYVKFRGEEYFKVHDTLDNTPKWWRILKHQTITADGTTYNDQIMLERKAENGTYQFYMIGRISNAISMTVIQIPEI